MVLATRRLQSQARSDDAGRMGPEEPGGLAAVARPTRCGAHDHDRRHERDGWRRSRRAARLRARCERRRQTGRRAVRDWRSGRRRRRHAGRPVSRRAGSLQDGGSCRGRGRRRGKRRSRRDDRALDFGHGAGNGRHASRLGGRPPRTTVARTVRPAAASHAVERDPRRDRQPRPGGRGVEPPDRRPALWLCAHEMAFHAVLTRPHVAKRLEELVVAHAQLVRPDPRDLEGLLQGIDPGAIPGLSQIIGDPSLLGDADTGPSPELETVRAQLASLTAAIAGYAEYVTSVVASRLIGAHAPIGEAMRRRRVGRGEGERVAESLFGLHLDQEDIDRGAAFVQGVLERSGELDLARMWVKRRTCPRRPRSTPRGCGSPASISAPPASKPQQRRSAGSTAPPRAAAAGVVEFCVQLASGNRLRPVAISIGGKFGQKKRNAPPLQRPAPQASAQRRPPPLRRAPPLPPARRSPIRE